MQIPSSTLIFSFAAMLCLIIALVYYMKKQYHTTQEIHDLQRNYNQPITFKLSQEFLDHLKYMNLLFGRPIETMLVIDGDTTQIQGVRPYFPQSEAEFAFQFNTFKQQKDNRSEIG